MFSWVSDMNVKFCNLRNFLIFLCFLFLFRMHVVKIVKRTPPTTDAKIPKIASIKFWIIIDSFDGSLGSRTGVREGVSSAVVVSSLGLREGEGFSSRDGWSSAVSSAVVVAILGLREGEVLTSREYSSPVSK